MGAGVRVDRRMAAGEGEGAMTDRVCAYYVCWVDCLGRVTHAAVDSAEQLRETIIEWVCEDIEHNYEPSEYRDWTRSVPHRMSFLQSWRYIHWSIQHGGGMFIVRKIAFTGWPPTMFSVTVDDYDLEVA